MSEDPTCPKHGIQPGWCPACEEQVVNAPDPDTMTPDERAAEMRDLGGPCFVHFDIVHKRVEALCGRPVWRHEMALWDLLVEEAYSRQMTPMETVIDRLHMLAGDKPVIIIQAPEGGR